MLHAQAEIIRSICGVDTETRNAIGGVPYSKDIVAGLQNTKKYATGELSLERPRTRLGQVMQNERGEIIGWLSVTVVLLAKPTQYEHRQIWRDTSCDTVSGVFLRSIVVRREDRSKGYGAILFDEVRGLAKLLELPLYCDVKAENTRMRKFILRGGYSESVYWSTPKGTPMVRFVCG